MGLFSKIKEGLQKTRKGMGEALAGLFSSSRAIDDDLLEELEDALIMADVGAALSEEIVSELRTRIKEKKLRTPEEAKAELEEIITGVLTQGEGDILTDTTPTVILIIGVNGVGKTTTIGKLAAGYVAEGKKVLLAAGDTFRAAAAEQLTIWAQRAGCDIVRHGEGADPAAVVFDAVNAARARKTDILICDTAGRLHNKANLMAELAKINRVILRELPEARVETLLIIDATTGQNGLLQAREFEKTAGITGVVLTKLDGTAKGGIALAICRELSVPVKRIGVGEKKEDLLPFDAHAFAAALLEGDKDEKEEAEEKEDTEGNEE